ncbi:UMP-CMP kinase-like Protein [Tribolium castaneum]|uniref:UMP-CMP kinase n=1 Tax=Tribolium castaneum TaxID=7070 RepID=D6WRF9_TRICA|nr:PREDICTED: UMP-CMP kinase [Tribolium castaneum]EFA06562.1 UMP-CMP kinase-like Protein [Tribolium castaneum]|eukprot:XP_015836706.1 PREDICTED: UMP-CMP kinase [Tribolium castaneum]
MGHKKVVFVLGPPGVGKGTQCRKIASYYGFVHISAGELLRRERQVRNSVHGELIDSCIKDGKIVPAEITCKLLERHMEESQQDRFLIDGFPRNLENREGWSRTIGDKVEVMFVLFIDCPVEVCIERCLNRGAAAGSGRFDDTIEVIEKRVATHLKETQPTVDYYRELNLLRVVDGNKSEDAVFEDIKLIFNDY